MINMKKVGFKPILDAEMYLLVEKGMRDGVSYISKRTGRISKNYLKSDGKKQESKRMIYIDPNTLYGYAMSKFLPTGELTWINPKEIDMKKYNSDNSKGCVLKFFLEYPKELHQLLKEKMMSKYQVMITDLYNIPIGNGKNCCLTFLIKKGMSFIMKTCNFI